MFGSAWCLVMAQIQFSLLIIIIIIIIIKKHWTSRTLANPPTLCPITSDFCLPPTPLKVDVTCVSPLSKNKPLLYLNIGSGIWRQSLTWFPSFHCHTLFINKDILIHVFYVLFTQNCNINIWRAWCYERLRYEGKNISVNFFKKFLWRKMNNHKLLSKQRKVISPRLNCWCFQKFFFRTELFPNVLKIENKVKNSVICHTVVNSWLNFFRTEKNHGAKYMLFPNIKISFLQGPWDK